MMLERAGKLKMIATGILLTLLLMVMTLTSLSTSLAQVSATRTVGVQVGSWWEVSVVAEGNMTGFNATNQPDYAKFNVTGISGTNVTLQTLWRYANGTQMTLTGSVDVENGSGDLTGLIIAADLNKGDQIYNGTWYLTGGQDESGATINDTLTRNYLGSNVEVCHWNWTRRSTSTGYNASTSWNYFWLRDSGILAETAQNMTVVETGAYYWEYLGVTITGYFPAGALTGSITINPDGSISSPVPANITTSDNVTYTFTGNNYLPIVVNRSNIIINGNGHALEGNGSYSSKGFFLWGVSNVTIRNTTITNSGTGIDLHFSSGNVFSDNNVTANRMDGIDLLDYSSGNFLSGDSLTANGYDGVYLDYSSGNILSGNSLRANGVGTFIGYSSSGNVFSGNNVTESSYYGIWLYSSCDNNSLLGNNIKTNGEYGIEIESSCDNNTLSGNNVTANTYAGIDLYFSSGNFVSGNNVAANGYGIVLNSAPDNRIFHNNFLNNTQQTYLFNSTDTWDDGYPSGGNYWSNYLTKYPNAVENDSSGIWNAPYVIDVNNTDRYPLMGPFRTFNVGTWNNTPCHIDIVSDSTITNFSFTAFGNVTPQLPFWINFTVTTTNGTTGFCRVTIPKELTSVVTAGWAIEVNYTLVPGYINETNGCTYIYFTYPQGTATITLGSPKPVETPEFQPSMLLPLFMIITLIGAITFKKRVTKTRC
jgi:parallel beta-helix repeat protein